MRNRKKTPQLVWVEFLDHDVATGWKLAASTDPDRAGAIVHAVGWVISEDKEILQLASWHIPSRDADITDTNLRSCIVKGAITKRKRIKEF